MAEPGLVRYKPFDTLVDAQADGTLDNRMIFFIDGVMHRKIDGDILPIGTYIGALASYPALGDSASLYVDPTNNKLYIWDSTSTSYIEFSKPSALPENQFLNGSLYYKDLAGVTSADMSTVLTNYRTVAAGIDISQLTTYTGVLSFDNDSISNGFEITASNVLDDDVVSVMLNAEASKIGNGFSSRNYGEQQDPYYITQQISVDNATLADLSFVLEDSGLDNLVSSGVAEKIYQTPKTNLSLGDSKVFKIVYRITPDGTTQVTARAELVVKNEFFGETITSFAVRLRNVGVFMGNFQDDTLQVLSNDFLSSQFAKDYSSPYYEKGNYLGLVPVAYGTAQIGTGDRMLNSILTIPFKSKKVTGGTVTFTVTTIEKMETIGGTKTAITLNAIQAGDISEDNIAIAFNSEFQSDWADIGFMYIEFDWEYKVF